MQENYAGFPQGVLELARTHNPEFIVASDAYRPLPQMVSESMPEYELVDTFQYSQPNSYFFSPQKIQTVSVFQKQDN
jgi:hypothetical protein